MGHNDHIDDDGGLSDFLEQLIDGGDLEGAAEGVTKLVIAQGVQKLTPKQMHVFDQHVIGAHTVSECSRCSSNIPWSEMYEALDNGGLCNYCWHMSEKSKEE